MKKYIKTFVRNLIPWNDRYKKIYKLYLKSHKWINNNNEFIANYYANKIYKKYNCFISPKAVIGKNLIIPHPIGIVIGEGVKIGDNCTIYQNVTIGRKNRGIPEYPEIKDNVIIYCNSTIIGNIEIGNNSIIGCNSIVLKSISENSKCSGVVK